MKKFSKIILLLCMLVLTGTVFAACGAPKITDIKITGVPQYVIVGEEFTLEAVLTPAKASQKDVVWSTSDSNIASVNDAGKVTPLQLGTVIITAMSKKDSSIKDSVSISINSKSTDIIINNLTAAYDGLPKSVVAQNVPDGVSLVYKYSAVDYPESEEAPVNAGIYSVKVYPLNGNTVLAQCILTINPRNVVIRVDDKSKVFGANDPEFTSSITGLIGIDTIDYTLGKTSSKEDVGDYPITATINTENPNYKVSVVNGTLKILQRDVKIVPQNKSSVYGDPLQGLTFEIQDIAGNALNNIDVSNVSGSLKIVTEGNLEKLGAGSYTISSADLISKNLNIREKSSATYTITKRTAYVNVASNQGKFAGKDDPELVKIISNTAYGDDLSACLSREPGETVGFYQYLLDQTINENYILTFTSDSVFAINANKVTIGVESFFIPYSPSQSNEYIPADKLIYTISINGVSGYATVDASGYIILQEKGNERILLGVSLQQVASLTEAEKVNIYQKMKMTPEPIQQDGISDPKKYDYTFEDTYKYITKLDLTITADNAQKYYKDDDPAFTFKVDGLISGDTAAVASTVTFARDKSGSCEDVGSYEINVDKKTLQDGKDYYKPIFVSGTLTIVKRPITIKPISYTQEEGNAVYYGEPERLLDYDTTEANLPNAVRLTDVFKGTLTKAAGTSVGSYAITIKNLEVNKNYELHFTPGVYEIIPRPWYVYAANKTITYGDGVNGFLYTDEAYKGDDGTIDYVLEKPIFNGKLALTKNQTLYANNLEDGDTTNDYYEIGQGNLTAGGNFTIIFNSGKLTVTKRQVTLSFIPQTYAFGSEQPEVMYAFSPSLASGDRVSRLDYISDNTVNSNIYVLKNVEGVYNYSLELVNSNNKLVNDCYTININEQATDLFYVGASLLNIKLVSKQTPSSNTSVITYGDIYDFNELFKVEIVDNTNNYILDYTSTSFVGLTVANPTDAGNYTISVVTNPASENAIKVKTAGGEDISQNFGFSIAEFGMLTINKANLALQVAPVVDQMPYGTQYPDIHDAEYVFYNASTNINETFISEPSDYIVSDYSKNNVSENAYIIRAVFSPDVATNPEFKNFNIYTHEGLELYIIKQEKDTESIDWEYGNSFDHDAVDNGDGTFTVEFDADTVHNVYKSDYETAGNTLQIPEELKFVSPTVAYIYQGIYFSNDPAHRGQLPYVIDADTTGYIAVANNATYRATIDASGTISIYYITEDGEGNEVVYLLDNKFIERSSTAPIRAGIFYVTARLSTTNPNYTFSKQDYSCLYLVKKAAATVYFVEEQTGVVYNKDLPLELTLTTDVLEASVKILGYKQYINGGTDTIECLNPVNVGDYIAIVEVDTENHYINQERGFSIIATSLGIVFGNNTEVNFKENVAQSVDFYFTANGLTLFAYTNGQDDLETALAQLSLDYPWLKYQFTLNESLLPDGELPCAAQNNYKITFTIDTTIDEGKNYTISGDTANSCTFSIIPKIYSGNIRLENAEINYDATYEQEGGNARMYEAIYNAMVRDPNEELLSGDYTLTLKTNSGLIINDTETDFVSVINHAGKTFAITLIISGSNTSPTEKTATLSVVKAEMPRFRYYSETSTSIDYTGQRIFNPLTDNNGNIYSPTIRNTAASTWTYAERDDADTYFGITYTYYKVEGTKDILLEDAPIAIENNIIVQYKVVAVVKAGANYKEPPVDTYTGLFTIAKTTFNFNRDEDRQINYTYGIETDEITIGAKNKVGVSLVLTFDTEDNSPYEAEDGIVCLRYYTASNGTVYTSLPKNADTYTVTFKIVSSKSNFSNEGTLSDFEATKTLIISPRQIDQCDTLITYQSDNKAPDRELLYAKLITKFTYKNKSSFPDHLKELFASSSNSNPYIYFDLYDENYVQIFDNLKAANIYSRLNEVGAGKYYYTLEPITDDPTPNRNRPNFCISDYYELIIYHNPVTISFDLTKGNVVYNEATETYSMTVGYTAGANPFDVSNIKVTGRLSGDREVLTYSDYIVRYKVQGAHFSTFTTQPPVTQGKYDVEIVLKNETYISNDRDINEDPATAEILPLQLVYEIYAPTLQLSPSVNNYTYQNYNANNFIIDAYYNGVSRGQYNQGTQTNGAWVLNQEMLDAGVYVTYDGEANPTNVTQLVRDTIADAQDHDPSIKLSTIAEFNSQNAGTYVAYVIYISSDRNFAPTIGTITFTVDKKPITFTELTMPTGQVNMVHDTTNNKFIYTLPLTANVTFSNGWAFDDISLTGPSTTKLIIVDGGIEIEVYINYSTFEITSADLVASFKVSGTTHHTQAVTITSITENTGNYDLSSLLNDVHFEMNIKVAKGQLPTNVFSISSQTVPYNSKMVKAKEFSTSDADELAFSNYVTLNTTTDAGSENAYKIFNKAYTDEDKPSFLEFMSLQGIYLSGSTETDITNNSDYVLLKNRLIKNAKYGTYIFRYTIPESIYFNATTIEFTHNIEPKAINATLSTQLIVSGGDLPVAKLSDSGTSIDAFKVNVEIRLANADKSSTPLVSFTQESKFIDAIKDNYITNKTGSIDTLINANGGNNAIFAVTIELLGLGGLDIDNMAFENADEGTPRKTSLYALYISSETDLGVFDIYGSIDNNDVLEKVLGSGNEVLIHELGLSLEWSSAIESALDMSNYILTENVIVAMLTPENLSEITYVEDKDGEGNIISKTYSLNVADKLNDSHTYDADSATEGIQGWEAPVYILVGEDRIRTTLTMTVKFEITLEVTDTTFAYDGTKHVPNAKLKLYSFNFKRTFPNTGEVDGEGNIIYGTPSAYYIPVLEDIGDQSGLSVIYKKNGTPIANPVGAGEYEAVYTYTIASVEYKQSIPFTISAELVPVTMNSMEVAYDSNPHGLTASAEKDGTPLNIIYEYIDENGISSTTKPTNAGIYKVIATVNEDNYEGSATAILTIRKLSTRIDIIEIANPVYGSGQYVPTYEVYDEAGRNITDIISIENPTYKLSKTGTFGNTAPSTAGDFAIKIRILEQPNYFANELIYNYSIARADATPTVTLPTASELVYDGNAKEVSAYVSDGRTPTIKYNGSTTAPKNVGLYQVEISFTANTNYNQVVQFVVIEITPAQLVVEYTGHDNRDTIEVNYVENLSIPFNKNCDVAVTYAGFSYKEDGTLNTTSQSFGSNLPTLPGVYTATHKAADPNYEGTLVFTIKINRISSTLALIGTSHIYDGDPYSPGIDNADFANYTTTYTGSQYDGTVYNSTNAPTNAGQYTLTVDFAGNQIYLPTTSSIKFTIQKATASLTLENMSTSYTGERQTPTVVFKVNNVAVEGFDKYQFVFASDTVAPINAGQYSVYAYCTDNNYTAISTTGTFTINPADIIVELTNEDGEYTYDTDTGSLINKINGSSDISMFDIVYTGKTYMPDGTLCTENNFISTHIPTLAGEYTASVHSHNYKSTTFTFKILKKTESIALNNITTTVGNFIELAPTISGLKVEYSFKAPSDAEYSTIMPTAAGTYSIKADIVDPNYQGSTTATLTINTLTSNTNYIYIKNQYFMYDGDEFYLEEFGARLFVNGVEVAATKTSYEIFNGSSYVAVSSIKDVGQYKIIMEAGADKAEQLLEVLPEIDIRYPSNAIYTGETINTIRYEFVTPAQQTTAITSNLTFAYNKDGKYVNQVLNAGNYTVSLLYKNFVIKEQDFVVAKQEVTLPTSLADIKYGDTLSATQNSYKVKYQYSLDNGITFSDKIPNAGTYKVMIIVDEENYTGTQIVELTIKKRSFEFNIGDVECNYTGSDISLPTTYKNFNIISYRFSTSNSNYSTGTPREPGEYCVQAVIGETNYEITYPGGLNYFRVKIKAFTPDYVVKDTVHTYDGTAKAITATLFINGTQKRVVITYSEENPTNVGNYTATLAVEGDVHYLTKQVTMTINPATPTITYELPQELTFDENLKEITNPVSSSGAAVTVKYYKNGNEENPINAGNYTAVLSCPAIGNYAACEVTIAFTINQAMPTFNYYIEDNEDVVYDSHEKPGYSIHAENCTVTATYKKSGVETTLVNAGTYNVTFTITAANSNYRSYEVTTTYTIYKAENIIRYTLPSLVTDSYEKKLTGLSTLVSGQEVTSTYTIDGASPTDYKKAGIYTVVLKSAATENYLACELTVVYEVTKQDTRLSLVPITDTTYDTNPKEITVDNPNGIDSSKYEIKYKGKKFDATGKLVTNHAESTTKPTDAGVYTAKIYFKDDNLTTSQIDEITFVIHRKVLNITIDLSDLAASDKIVEFNGTTYTATASASNADAKTPDLIVKTTLNGADATEIKDGGIYELIVDVNDKNHVGYARRVLLITKKQAYIFLRSSAIEYGQEIVPEYILRDSLGNEIDSTNASPIVTLYDQDGNIVPTTDANAGVYKISIVVNSSGYMASGMFPFTIRPATPQLYYKGDTNILVDYTSEEIINLVTLDVKNLYFSIDGGNTDAGILYSGGTLLSNAEIKVTYSTIIDGSITEVEVDLSTSTIVPNNTNAYTVTIKANKDLANDNYEIITISCLITVGEPIV